MAVRVRRMRGSCGGWARSVAAILLIILGASVFPEAAAFATGHPNTWSIDDVCEWAKESGFQGVVGRLRKHDVGGGVLLSLNERDLENDLSMTSGIERKRFLLKLEELRKSGHGKPGPRHFWQYRELDRNSPSDGPAHDTNDAHSRKRCDADTNDADSRKRCDIGTMLLTGAPRLAFLLWMTHDDLGHGLAASSMKWMFPHIEIARHYRTVMTGLPGGLLFGHMVMGVLEPVIILYAASLYMTGKYVEKKAVKRVLFYEPLKFFGWMMVFYFLYPVIPRFWCEAVFYIVLFSCWYHPPVELHDFRYMYSDRLCYYQVLRLPNAFVFASKWLTTKISRMEKLDPS